ncbi:MAG: glycosyltransferase family 39 protein [Gemmatimonadota bacterium]|nr:glycosyltransferase family 39 protein [Gemmatimonadota bacterium]
MAPALWGVLGLTVLGLALRGYRLGAWGLSGDEVFTLRDSVSRTSLVGPKPLLFLLNYYLIGSWTALDELGLRILPMIFGVAAIPTLYWGTTTLADRRAGLYAAALLTVNGWHIYWSQFARYYTLVFLLTTVAVVALIRAVQVHRPRWTAIAVVSAAMAILAHPSAALPIGGVGIWELGTYLRELRWGRRPTPWRAAFLAVVLAIFLFSVAWYLGPILLRWYRADHAWGHQGPLLILSYADGLSLSLLIFSIAGALLARTVLRPGVWMGLTSAVLVPLVFIMVVSYVVPVSNAYLYAVTPILFIWSGVFFSRLDTAIPSTRVRAATVGACLAVVLLDGAPRLWSHYQTGTRPDIRGAAAYVESHSHVSDWVLADQPYAFQHYLPSHDVRWLDRDPDALAAALATGVGEEGRAAMWVLEIRQQRGGFNERDLGPANAWVRAHCTMERFFGVPRLDYKRDDVIVYRCTQPELSYLDRTGTGKETS